MALSHLLAALGSLSVTPTQCNYFVLSRLNTILFVCFVCVSLTFVSVSCCPNATTYAVVNFFMTSDWKILLAVFLLRSNMFSTALRHNFYNAKQFVR